MPNYAFSPPYTRAEYDAEYAQMFGDSGFISEYIPVYGMSELVHFETDFSTIEPIGKENALEQFTNDYYHYIKTSAELEGFSTTEEEVFELMNTDDLSQKKRANTADKRLATIVGLAEGIKKVIHAVESNRGLNSEYLCDLNESFAFATKSDVAGHFRGEKAPNLKTRITFGDQVYIPIIPEYGQMNVRGDFEEFFEGLSQFGPISAALKREANNVYKQYFSDGNNRTSFYFAVTMLINAGYKPFRVNEWSTKEFLTTKSKLFLQADARAREKLLFESMAVGQKETRQDTPQDKKIERR